MQLDPITLLAASCGLMITVGGMFVVLWLRDRTAKWLAWWGVAIVANGLVLLLYLRPEWQTDTLNIVVGNGMRIGLLCALWTGIRRFQQQSIPWMVMSVALGLWLAACTFPPFMETQAARIALLSAIHAVITGLAAFDLWRARSDGLRSRAPTLAVFVSYTVLMVVRIGVVNTAPFPVGAAEMDPLWLAMYSWVVLGHALLAAIFFLMMTMEAREERQRSFAMSDPLTGLMNRRAFSDFAQRFARRRPGLRDPLSLLVLDLDKFKHVNDAYGHEVGDRMLKAFAEVSEESVRPTDQLFRMGGEEFCFILPDTALDDAIGIAERIRRAFEGVRIETGSDVAATTVSIGIAATAFAVDMDVLLAAADAAVYEAKARGRNRVVVAEPSTLLRGHAAAASQRRRA